MKKAIVFIDYNDTVDDINKRGGEVFKAGVKKFLRCFNNNADFVIITASKAGQHEEELKEELTEFLFKIGSLSKHFKFLIQSASTTIDKIHYEGGVATFEKVKNLKADFSDKKRGVESFLNYLDRNNEITTCVFIGDSEKIDLPMMSADVGNREKFFIHATSTRKAMLKGFENTTYRLSFHPNAKLFYDKGGNFTLPNDLKIVKTSPKSYGVGKGLEVLSAYLERGKDERNL